MSTRCRLGSWTLWGLLVVQALAFSWPGHAAEGPGEVFLAHLSALSANPQQGESVVNPPPAPPAAASSPGGEAAAVSTLLPHGICLSWRPGLLWTHIVSDSLIALAYFSMPVALMVFARRRRDLQCRWMFVLFGVFIMACGTGHLLSLYNLWVPDYVTSGAVKALTAVVSVVTAAILWPLIPKALALPGPAQWEAVNGSLRKEVAERREAETEVRRLNAELEQRVAERTAELEAANHSLAEANRELRERGARLQAFVFRSFDQRVLAAAAPLEAEAVAPLDDGLHTYISNKAPLFDAAGRPYAVCGISADITERKRSEQEIRRLNAELQQKVAQLVEAQEELLRKEKLAILGQFSGSVGHELRNPLGVMSNAVYFLKTVLADADETVREYLGIIEQEIANSQRIITDLLDFARTRPPQKASASAADLVRQSLGKCAVPENVTVALDLPESLPQIAVDPLQMGQVLVNFITNGVQAMPEGGALCVAARRVRSEESGVRSTQDCASPLTPHPSGDFIEISVADTGEGISPENMQKLFQPLFTTKPKGIGLGLVVCRNLVEANGGRIEVESELGKGTTFALALPAEGREG